MSDTNTNTGGPAFPSGLIEEANDTIESLHKGMTLRDYFAAKAMQGICASGPGFHMSNDKIAAESYELADAMLKARAA